MFLYIIWHKKRGRERDRVQREIRIDEEVFPEEEIIQSQTMIKTKLVSNLSCEDGETVPLCSGYNDKNDINAKENGFGLRSYNNSNDKSLDQNPISLSQDDNDIKMENDEPKMLPRIPVIEGVEIVKEEEEEVEEKDSKFNEKQSEEVTNLSPSPYKKKSLLEAPEHSRRRSKSRKRSRSRHNVVYHFGMA